MDNCLRFTSLRHETYRSFLCCLIALIALLLIVNNGNILADGVDERKYLRRKYNDLMICGFY